MFGEIREELLERLNEQMKAVADIDEKKPGNLIKSDDWNAVVALLLTLAERTEAGFEAVEERMRDLGNEIEGVKDALDTVRDRVDTVAENFYRMTMQTTRQTVALGEQAELVIQVTDLFGAPVTNRPWVDFVASWGQFKAASGFTTRIGEGERTISVRTNSNGEARVLLRSDHVENDDDDDDENSVIGLLASEVMFQNQSTPIWQVVTEAATPAEAAPAYMMMTNTYNQVESFQRYTDKYYYDYPVYKPYFPQGTWKDYRSTVMAFVKDDSNAQTPDAGRGFSTIQVIFRDWISAWVGWDYFEPTIPGNIGIIDNFQDRFRDVIFEAPQFELNDAIKDIIGNGVRMQGRLGRERDLIFVNEAIGTVINEVPDDNILQNQVLKTMKEGVGIQLAIEGKTQPQALFAINGISGAASSSGGGVEQVSADVGRLTEELGQARASLDQANNTISNLQLQVQNQAGSIDAILSPAGPLDDIRSRVSNVEGQIGSFAEVDINQLNQASSKVRQLEVEQALILQQIRGLSG